MFSIEAKRPSLQLREVFLGLLEQKQHKDYLNDEQSSYTPNP